MKETDGWVKIKKYTDDGRPVCWGNSLAKCDLYWRLGGVKGCGYIANGSPGPSCPVWHGESKSEWQEISSIPETYGLYLVMCNSSNGYELMRFTDRGWEYYQYPPTHWMPLPSPPQEK